MLTIAIIISNAVFAGVLTALYIKQRKLEDDMCRAIEEIDDSFDNVLDELDELNEDAENNKNVHYALAERLCNLESTVVDMELDAETKNVK